MVMYAKSRKQSMKMDKPDKMTRLILLWLPYSTLGTTIPGTRFIAFKVPLRESFLVKLKPEDKFTIPILLKRLPSLGLVIDLTQTVRYYNKNEFLDRGVDYVKIATPGQEVPPQQLVDKFFEVVDYFLETHKNESTLIGVHCTHGVNRTGYMIGRYLIQRMNFSFEEAVEIVGRSRGHMIERSPYLASLRKHVGPVKMNALNRSLIEASRQKKVEVKPPKKPPPPRRLGKETFGAEPYPSRGGRTRPDVRVKSPREMTRTVMYGPPPHGAFSPPSHPGMRGRSPVRIHRRSPQPIPNGRTPPFPMRRRSPTGMRGLSPLGMRGRSLPLGIRGRSPPPVVGRSRGHMIERSPYLASLRKHVGPVKKNALNRSSIEASRQKKVEEKPPKKPPPPRRLGKETFGAEPYPSRGGRTPPDVRVKSPREIYDRTMMYGPPPHGAFSPPSHPGMRGRSPVRMHGRSPQPAPHGRTPPFPMRGRSPQGMRGRSPSPGMRGRSPMGLRGRSPPLGMRGRSPPLGIRGRSPPPSVRGRSPPPSIRGRSPPPGLRGRSPPPGIRGRSPPPGIRGRSPPLGIRGRSPPPSVRGRSPVPMRGRSSPPGIRGRSPPPGMRGRSPPPGMRGRSPPSNIRGRSPSPGMMGRSPPRGMRGRSPPSGMRGRSPPLGIRERSPGMRPPPGYYGRSSPPMLRGYPLSQVPGERSSPPIIRGRSSPSDLHRSSGHARMPPPDVYDRSSSSLIRGRTPPPNIRGRTFPSASRGRSPPSYARGRSPQPLRSGNPAANRGRSPPGKRVPPPSFRDRSPLRRRSISPSGRREALHPRNRSRSPSSLMPGRPSSSHPVRRRTPPSDRRDLLIPKRGRSPHMSRGDGPPLRDRSLSPRRDNLTLSNMHSRSPLPPPKANRDRDMGRVEEAGVYHGFRDYVGNFSPGRNKNYSDSGYAPEYVGRSNPNRPNSRSPRRESDTYYHDSISKFTSSGDFVPPKDKRKRKSPSPLDKRATKDRRSPSDYSNGRGGVSGSAYWENEIPLDGPDCREILNEKRSLKEPFPDIHDEPFQEKGRRFSQDRFNSQEVDIREALDQEKRKRALQNPEDDVFPAMASRANDGIRHSVREYGESSGSHPRRGGDDRDNKGSHSYSKGSSYQGGGDDRKMNSGGHLRGSMGRGGGGGYRGQGDDKRRAAYRGKPSHRGARTAPFWT